jgi:predicted helicase
LRDLTFSLISLVAVAALGDLLSRLDPDRYRRGKQFERICQWFLTHDPVYAHELHRVWLWDEWPGRWGAEAGIDLVAEDRRGHLWAIQAKAYDPATTVTKDDVNTFLSESARARFSFRLLIATTNLMGHIAKRTMEGKNRRVSCFSVTLKPPRSTGQRPQAICVPDRCPGNAPSLISAKRSIKW